MPRWISGLLLLAAPLGVSAQLATRDSAGIRIVTHTRAARPAATWRIGPQPIVEIGGEDGSGPTLFGRIWSVARAATGEILITDEPSQEIRVFDSQGKYLRTFGRKGEGPGEFSQIRDLAVYGDTVYAIDTRRSTAFTLAGKLIRQTPFPLMDQWHPVDPWGAFSNGAVIETAAGRETREYLSQTGTRIENRALLRIDADSRSYKVLGVVPTFEFYRGESDPLGGDLVAFAPMMTVAVFGDRFCTGRGSKYEIACADMDGKPTLIVRRDLAPAPITPAAREAYLKMLRAPITGNLEGHAPPPQSVVDQRAARTHFADAFPAFERTMAGDGNELWVSDYQYQLRVMPRGEQPPASSMVNWNVFSKNGAWIASVSLPARFSPRRSGRDYILGVSRDDNGVESATMYRLIR